MHSVHGNEANASGAKDGNVWSWCRQVTSHYLEAANGPDLCNSSTQQRHRSHKCDSECLAVQVYYTVDSIGEGGGKDWKGGVGYVTREMATQHIPPPSDDNLVLVCGPPPMYKALSGEKKSPKDQGEGSL